MSLVANVVLSQEFAHGAVKPPCSQGVPGSTTLAATLATTPAHLDAAQRPVVDTNGWRAPERTFERRMFADGTMRMPDGELVRYWGFEDPTLAPGRKSFPAPLIRAQEGENIHITLETHNAAARGQSERSLIAGAPSPSRALAVDGCDSSVYQWQPRKAGTWFYQSHNGTAHDFEMGLYGVLVVDPAPDGSGRKMAYAGGPSYDAERIWIFDDIDPSWHDEAQFAKPAAGGPVRRAFNPKYFLVNGVANTETAAHGDVAVQAKRGDKLLIRLFNASYSLLKVSLGGLRGDIISVDGSPLGSPERPWTSWIPVHSKQPIYMATASRHDVLIDLDPSANGCAEGSRHEITFEFLDMTKRCLRNATASHPAHIGRAATAITVL